MNHTEKPFACRSLGCNMSFTNEDHLVVHTKKHDMILTLGNGKPAIFIDQTPTPTRFIRNCEEVGLFQDLQHVNPFEETFRKAVEFGKLESIPDADTSEVDDTLHTPQVFLDDVADKPIITKDLTKFNDNEEKKDEDNSEITVIMENKIKPVTKTKTIIIQADKVTNPELESSFVDKQKLQNGQLNVELEESSVFITEGDLLECYTGNDSGNEDILSSHSYAKMHLRQLLNRNKSCTYFENPDQNENYSLETSATQLKKENCNKSRNVNKKLEILERNRASSMRARAKRKAWIEQLETSLNKVNKVNAVLQADVRTLRLEVANLKNLLLAHKDCPVTKAMEGNETPKIISMTPQLIQIPITINDSPGQGVKRILVSNQVPIDSKIKPPISTPKQSILLPKVNKSRQIFTKIERHPHSNLKVIKIDQTATEKTTGNKFYFVNASSARNSQVVTSQKILPVEPTSQLIYLASGNTGTK